MTDGAARVLELELKNNPSHELKEAFRRLTSRDPKEFWTSGQWMTERTGGSDVGNSETVAVAQPDGSFALSGYKMAVTLAKIADKNGNVVKGSRGLSAFYVEMRKPNGELANINVMKLKEKLGNRAVPTAELELKGTPAKLLGEVGKGVPAIANQFNITRIYTGVCSVGTFRRGIAVARDYALRRKVFGNLLSDQPLHLSTLASLEVAYRGSLFFVMDAVVLLGKSECGTATPEEEERLRLLTPLVKLYTAKECLWGISECIECLGGTGYMEDATELPRLLRDQQVNTIWEGTTNVLSLDVLRARAHNESALAHLQQFMETRARGGPASLHAAVSAINEGNKCISEWASRIASQDRATNEARARDFAYLISATYALSSLVEHAVWSRKETDVEIANRWSREKLFPLIAALPPAAAIVALRARDRDIALDVDEHGQPTGHGDVCGLTGKLRCKL